MRKVLKSFLCFFLFYIFNNVFGDVDQRLTDLEKKVDQISKVTANSILGPVAASARAEPDGMGWNLSLDVLYWQTKTDTAYCNINDGIVIKPINFQETSREAKFQWEWGFKVAAGRNFEYDQWDSKVEYTYFKNKAKDLVNTLSLPSGVTSPLLTADFLEYESLAAAKGTGIGFGGYNILGVFGFGPFSSNTEAFIKNSYNNLLLDLGRELFLSQKLSIRPGFGCEAAWLRIKGNIKFWGGNSFTVTATGPLDRGTARIGTPISCILIYKEEKFFGVGPRASLDTKWHLGESFSVFGNVNGALLFGYFNNFVKSNAERQPANEIRGKQNFHRLVPTAKFEIGLMYDKYIMCDTQHLSLSLGYENQYFFNVNYLNFTGNGPSGLGMYGAVLKGKWDF